MRKIDIFDTTLRDGEQSAGVNLHFNEKMEIAYQLERYGVDIIEAGFPASSEGDYRSVEEIAKKIKNCCITGLARSVKEDIDAVVGSLKHAVDPRLHIFLATSPVHMEYKLLMKPEEVVETAVATVKYGSKYISNIEWSAEDASRTDRDFLAHIVEKVIDAGAKVINIPDTVGFMQPQEMADLFLFLQERVPNIHKVKLSCHCHDDLGVAVANSLAAVGAGVHQVEGAINGIGERAGNASLEEVGVALSLRKDLYQAETNLDLTQTVRTSRLVSKLTGMIVPNNKAIVGANAFAHESGIHQDGVLKNKLTYEIIEPEMVGLTSNRMVMGKHSGRHAFKEKCDELSLELSDEDFKRLFKSFKDLTSKKKEVTDDDILALAMEASVQDLGAVYEIENLQVSYGSNAVPTATVGIKKPDGEVIQESATGKGSVEALYNTIERILGEDVKLIDYRIQSTTGGLDSLAEVYVKVTYKDETISGRGLDHDVLEASAKAYIDAINRINYKKHHRQSTKEVEAL